MTFEIIWCPNSMTEVLTIWNSNLLNALDGETTNIKVVDLDKNNNFLVDDFFIWYRLGF